MKQHFKIIIFIFSIVSLISSCTVEKRLHFPGHTVRWNHKTQTSHDKTELVTLNPTDTISKTMDFSVDDHQIKTLRIESTEPSNHPLEHVAQVKNNFISKVDRLLSEKTTRFNSIQKKVSSFKTEKKNQFKSIQKERRPDNDMWGFFGSILVQLLVALAIIIVLALIVVWLLSILPLATAKIIGCILLAALLLFFILS